MLAISGFITHRLYLRPDDETARNLLGAFLPSLLYLLDKTTDQTLQEGTFKALGQLCIFRTITREQIELHLPISTILDKLSRSAKTGNDSAIAALGQISVIFSEGEGGGLDQIIERIHDLHEIRQAESQFAVGEALACVACAWDSTAMAAKLDVDGPAPTGIPRGTIFDALIERTFSDSTQDKNSLRKVGSLVPIL